jgi:hypothetical protein
MGKKTSTEVLPFPAGGRIPIRPPASLQWDFPEYARRAGLFDFHDFAFCLRIRPNYIKLPFEKIVIPKKTSIPSEGIWLRAKHVSELAGTFSQAFIYFCMIEVF